MTQRLYVPPSNLEVPGLEAVLEYGQDSMPINDHSKLEKVRLTQLDGLHDDPEASESRQANADRHGETAGQMLYRGRTIGLTGRVEAGSIGAMRDTWRRFRGQFGVVEDDLLVHHPFEVQALINECVNPDLIADAFGWDTPSSTGGGSPGVVTGNVTDGIVKVGSVTLTSATGAGALRIYCQLVDPAAGANAVPRSRMWSGQDVWITARVKVHAATGTVSAIGLGLAQYSGGTTFTRAFPTSMVSQSSPATGTWYTISARIPASSVDINTQYVTPGVVLSFAGAGTYTVHFYRVALVLVDQEDPTPVSFFAGEAPGFEFVGTPGRSASVGPTHARNMIADPRFEDFTDPIARTLANWSYLTTGLTINQAAIRSDKWSGDNVYGALYFTATKDNNTTSRSMGVQPLAYTGQQYFPVIEGRRYRFSVAVNLLVKPTTGNVTASIQWVNEAGSVIQTNNSDPLAIGENGTDVAFVEQSTPAGAAAAKLLVWDAGTTTANAVLDLFVSDPCFVDVTEWDPGDFYGVGDVAQEVDAYRRIPRPFLLKGVRKTSDMKAPEQQSRSLAWRDFTMSLRASDPRIYCLDQRRRSYKMPLISQLKIATQNPSERIPASSFTINTAPAPVPIGSTYEGQSIPSTVPWSNQTITQFYPSLAATPWGGVNLRPWDPVTGAVITHPANPILARFYRSLEGYTYTEPRVIAGCSPVNAVLAHAALPAYGYAIAQVPSPDVAYSNEATVLLKRVSAGTWLELRWRALSNGRAHTISSSFATEPWAFELWCSHNTSGTLSTTRLATWDYTSSPPASVANVPFNPVTEKAYLDVSLVGNVVVWSLWVGGYPGPFSLTSPYRVESGFYALPAGLISIVGSAISGQAGFAMKVDNPTVDGSVDLWPDCALNPPFVHFLRFSNSSELAPIVEVPVIGDSDTQPSIVLSGLIVDPVVSILVPRDDGSYESFSVFLEGTINPSEQIVIGDGKIVDGSGANRYGMLRQGSRVPMLQPGLNYVTLSATNWDEGLSENMSIAWNDALR